MICQTCNRQLRYDRHLNAYFCADCEFILYCEERRPARKTRVGANPRNRSLVVIRKVGTKTPLT